MASTEKNKQKIKKSQKTLNLGEKAKIFVTATFNNTLVTATDLDGNTFAWEASGKAGFKGTRKATPFAATTTVEKLVGVIKAKGIKEVEVYIKGPGPGRESALRAIRAGGLKMNLIADVTPMPHNGVRPRKRRRG